MWKHIISLGVLGIKIGMRTSFSLPLSPHSFVHPFSLSNVYLLHFFFSLVVLLVRKNCSNLFSLCQRLLFRMIWRMIASVTKAYIVFQHSVLFIFFCWTSQSWVHFLWIGNVWVWTRRKIAHSVQLKYSHSIWIQRYCICNGKDYSLWAIPIYFKWNFNRSAASDLKIWWIFYVFSFSRSQCVYVRYFV